MFSIYSTSPKKHSSWNEQIIDLITKKIIFEYRKKWVSLRDCYYFFVGETNPESPL